MNIKIKFNFKSFGKYKHYIANVYFKTCNGNTHTYTLLTYEDVQYVGLITMSRLPLNIHTYIIKTRKQHIFMYTCWLNFKKSSRTQTASKWALYLGSCNRENT